MINEKKTDKKTVSLCLLCTLLWGAGYPVLKLSYVHWAIESSDVASKLLFAGGRFIIAGMCLLVIASIRKNKFAVPMKKSAGRIALLGIFQTTLQYGLLYIGLANTSGTKGSVLNQLSVFVVVLCTPIFFKSEKLTLRKIIGCIVGFSGITVMNIYGLSLSLEYGDLFVISSSTCAAIGYLISKGASTDDDCFTCTAYQQLLGGIVLLIIGACTGGKLTQVNFQGIICLLILVIVAAGAYSVWFYLLQHNEVSSISIYKFLTPVIGVTLSGLLLGEDILKLRNLFALVLVCAGVVIINKISRRKA